MLNRNKSILSLLLIVFIFHLAQVAVATGRTVGNGGDVVKCANQQQVSFQVLDFYEAELFNRAQIDIDQNFKNIDEQISFVLARLERVSPERARVYREQIKVFFQEVFWLQQGGLVDIPDSDHTTKPPAGCELVQAVNQSDPLLPSDKRYIIDQQIWNLLGDTQKVGLIFHEIIYREAIQAGHTNSVSTRYLNSLICSELMNSISEIDFAKILQKLGFATATVQGLQIDLTRPFSFYENNQLQSAMVVRNSVYKLNQSRLEVRDQVRFYKNGQIESLLLAGPSDFIFNGIPIRLQPFELSFYESGEIRSFILDSDLHFSSENYDLMAEGSVLLHPNQRPAIIDVKAGSVKLPKEFDVGRVPISGAAYFYQSGTIEQVNLDQEVIYVGLGQEFRIRGLLKLDEQQNPIQISLTQSESILVRGQKVFIKPFTSVMFKDKNISSVILQKKAVLKTLMGDLKTFFEEERVNFDENGFAIN